MHDTAARIGEDGGRGVDAPVRSTLVNRRSFLKGLAAAPVAAALPAPARPAVTGAAVANAAARRPRGPVAGRSHHARVTGADCSDIVMHVYSLDPAGAPIIDRGVTVHPIDVQWGPVRIG